jgi:sulfur transfer protein SufE
MLLEPETTSVHEVLPEKLDEIFGDFEARSNIVGFYDLLIKIAKRNPELWAEITKTDQTND